MKRTLLFTTTFVCILLISGCQKEPVADFTMDREIFKMDEVITFTNQSKSAKEFVWDFGDSKTSVEENPRHTYTSAGEFTITLTATGGGGTNTMTKTISVLPNLSGFWLKTIRFSEFGGNITGTMNITQHDDKTLTGSFAYDAGMGFTGSVDLLPTSYITKDSVYIKWDNSTNFNGTVNADGKTMGGKYLSGATQVGSWTAKKL
ncbi:MAG: PKD domain-containing protein [Bacteroidales bacterium]|jgi:PKD repeat protein